MRRSRISVALVAATAVASGLATPVAAAQSADFSLSSAPSAAQPAPVQDEQETQPNSELSPECQAEVDEAIADHQNAGSSFMGPQELIQGFANGYGSSGLPSTPDCVDEEKEEKEPEVELPEWAGSFAGDGTLAEIVRWISMFISVGAALSQLLLIVGKAFPAALDPIRNALDAAGIKL